MTNKKAKHEDHAPRGLRVIPKSSGTQAGILPRKHTRLIDKALSVMNNPRTPEGQRSALMSALYNLTLETDVQAIQPEWATILLYRCLEAYFLRYESGGASRGDDEGRKHIEMMILEVERVVNDPEVRPSYAAFGFGVTLAAAMHAEVADGLVELVGNICRVMDGREADTPEARSGLMASLGGLLDSARRRPASVVSMGRWRNKKGATSETATTTRPHSPPRALEL